MKKAILIKSAAMKPTTPPSVIVGNSSTTTQPTENEQGTGNTATYHQRKAMQSAYSEIFRALLRLPDKTVQKRVINAINGVETPCPQCSSQRSFNDAATQTEGNDTSKMVLHSNDNSNESLVSTVVVDSKNVIGANPIPDELETAVTVPPKRRRKRKVCLPQVIKRSHAEQAHHQQLPKMKKRKLDVEPNNTNEKPANDKSDTPALGAATRPRSDSLGSVFGFLSDCSLDFEVDLSNFIEFPKLSQEEHILQTMAKEYLESGTVLDGYMPIHIAINNNDIHALKRQIFVWKTMKKIDLNELITEYDEDCLQLAIMHDCDHSFIKVLLESGLNVDCTDEHSNTIIHLAVLNDDRDDKLESLDLLLRQIELSLLLKRNDDGYTPLLLAVRHDRFLQAEVLLNVLDDRLVGNSLYKRKTVEKTTKAEFLKYYENACEQLPTRFSAGSFARPKLKRKILEAGDLMSGNTALFYSVENKMEHFIYFLLAHLTDPRVPNHSGQDAKSFFGEFGKALVLSLKFDKAMDYVINLIDKL